MNNKIKKINIKLQSKLGLILFTIISVFTTSTFIDNIYAEEKKEHLPKIEIISQGIPLVKKGSARLCSEDEEVDRTVAELLESLKEYIVINKVTGKITKIGTENFLLSKISSKIKKIMNRRSPKMQEKINQALTDKLRDYGMSFSEKNGNKATFFDVAVNGVPMVLARESFDMLVQSTGPVLRANRALEQIYFSRDKNEITPSIIRHTMENSAGKKIECSDDEIAAMLTSMNDSIYDIPSLHGPEMKNFPFMAVAGVDAMIDNPDPDKITPIFAEFNLGTPSGISNIRYCMSAWVEKDPQMASAMIDKMAKDHTYQLLRETITRNAIAWSGNNDGITVMMGPGAGNGAHPDISSISYFSGMPLVTRSDLYIDKDGNVRLNAGLMANNPRVSGIYSRVEESFLLSEKGIPLISPNYNDIGKIMQKIIKTNPTKYKHLASKITQFAKGVWYDWEYGKNADGSVNTDDIIGVKLDEDGMPIALQNTDLLGVDPTIKEESESAIKRGSLLQAIKNRKLYTNVIGSRVVDDKKVFEIVSKCLAPLYQRGEKYVAAPPKSYTPKEFVPLLNKSSNEQLADFVLKEPDGSGGAGVYILVNYPPEERRNIVNKFLADPEMVKRMVVQQFVRAAAMTMPMSRDGVDRYYKPEVVESIPPEKLATFKDTYLTQANDLRIFVTMNEKGEVNADPHSVLVRTAKPTIVDLDINGDSRSNTSKGGGYGVLVVTESEATKIKNEIVNKEELLSDPTKLLTAEGTQEVIALSKRMAIDQYLNQLSNIKNWIGSYLSANGVFYKSGVEFLGNYHRNLMEILGPKFAFLMYEIRIFNQKAESVNDDQGYSGLMTRTESNLELAKGLHQKLIAFIAELCKQPPHHVVGLAKTIKSHQICQ